MINKCYLVLLIQYRSSEIDRMSLLDSLCKLKLAIKYSNQSVIDQYLNAYHNPHKIQIEDNYHFSQQEEYLKRYYLSSQFPTKIKLFKQYYKYHFEVPRIFLQEIQQIVQQNVDAKRELQYIHVSKKMEENMQKQSQFKNNSQTSKYSTSDYQNQRILDQLSFSTQINCFNQVTTPTRQYKRMTSLHPRQPEMIGFSENLPQEGLFLCNRKLNIKVEKQSPKHPIYQYDKFQEQKKPIKRCLQFFKNHEDIKSMQINKIKTLIEKNNQKIQRQSPKIVRKIVISSSTSQKMLQFTKNTQREKSLRDRDNFPSQIQNAIKKKLRDLSGDTYCNFKNKINFNNLKQVQNAKDFLYCGSQRKQDIQKIPDYKMSQQKVHQGMKQNISKKMFQKLIKTKKR